MKVPVSFRMSKEIHDKFTAYCKEHGVPVGKSIEAVLDMTMDKGLLRKALNALMKKG